TTQSSPLYSVNLDGVEQNYESVCPRGADATVARGSRYRVFGGNSGVAALVEVDLPVGRRRYHRGTPRPMVQIRRVCSGSSAAFPCPAVVPQTRDVERAQPADCDLFVHWSPACRPGSAHRHAFCFSAGWTAVVFPGCLRDTVPIRQPACGEFCLCPPPGGSA